MIFFDILVCHPPSTIFGLKHEALEEGGECWSELWKTTILTRRSQSIDAEIKSKRPQVHGHSKDWSEPAFVAKIIFMVVPNGELSGGVYLEVRAKRERGRGRAGG
jgi:hypothetical protein